MEPQRCSWVNLKNPLYVAYHDHEWGLPAHDDRHHFEMLCLEGMQAGLSWETILNRRENYRRLFDHFDVEKVATYGADKIEDLLQNPGIIRNRLKVNAIVINARTFIEVQKEFGFFDTYIRSLPLDSVLISKALKKRGFKFVGPTIIYAYLQACGFVNDHEKNCFLK